MKGLISVKADVNAADWQGETVLHSAAGNGRLECCKVLIEASINKDAETMDGETALDYAIKYRKQECVEYLLS